jgi:hypothetical protein
VVSMATRTPVGDVGSATVCRSWGQGSSVDVGVQGASAMATMWHTAHRRVWVSPDDSRIAGWRPGPVP